MKNANMASASIRLNPVGVGIIALLATAVLLYFVGLPSYNNKDKVNMRQLLSAAIDVAERGGKEVRRVHDDLSQQMNIEAKGKTKEGKDELKTTGDMASHRVMYWGIRNAFPDLEVESEEHDPTGVDTQSVPEPNLRRPEVSAISEDILIPNADITMWIDPLDATQEYTEDLTQYVTTMICVAIGGEPVIGVIHFPFKDGGYTVWAYAGHGHSQYLAPEEARKRSAGEPLKVIVSRSHTGDVETVVKEALGQDTEVIFAGGAGYKTHEVIQGRADIYVHSTAIKKWDICAGNAILNAISGKMSTLEDHWINYGYSSTPRSEVNEEGLLAAVSKQNHADFLPRLRKAFEQHHNQH